METFSITRRNKNHGKEENRHLELYIALVMYLLLTSSCLRCFNVAKYFSVYEVNPQGANHHVAELYQAGFVGHLRQQAFGPSGIWAL